MSGGLPFTDPEVQEWCADMAAVGYREGGFNLTARGVYDEFIGLGVKFERRGGEMVLVGIRLKTPEERGEAPRRRGLIGGPPSGPPPLTP